MTLPQFGIYGGLSQLGASAKAAAVIPWYLSGGIAAANCIAAYQPKGAADYAASKVNLANPGTYNAVNGATFPAWDTNGWTINICYLRTGIVVGVGWSMICRFTKWNIVDNRNSYLAGSYNNTGTIIFGICPSHTSNNVLYWAGNAPTQGSGEIQTGVLAISGGMGYKNGAYEVTFANTLAPSVEVWIGGLNKDGALSNSSNANPKIQALAIYNSTLTAPQVAALTTAMNLL